MSLSRGGVVDDTAAIRQVFAMMDAGWSRHAAVRAVAHATTADQSQQRAMVSRVTAKVANLVKAQASQ